MSDKLLKPYTKEQKRDFIRKYQYGYQIAETEIALYALEPNEIMVNGEPVINPNYEAEEAEKEKERIKNLTMTKRVLALQLQQLGVTYTKLKELIESNEQAQLEWELCERLERSNPLLDTMGEQLGITPEQIDNMFILANKE